MVVLLLPLLLLGLGLAQGDDCPDYECPAKDGSFAVSIPRLVEVYTTIRTPVPVGDTTPALTSDLSRAFVRLASTGMISSKEGPP